MEHYLFPSVPNTTEAGDLKEFYWIVSISPESASGKLTLRHCTSKAPILELTAPAPIAPPTWMADLLSWPEHGEFVLAVGRSLVVCLAVRGLRIRGQAERSGPGTFRVEGPGGPALVKCEWDEPLTFAPAGEGWLEARVPDGDLPLMIYAQTAERKENLSLTRKRLERFEKVDLGTSVAQIQKYQNDLPLWQIESDPAQAASGRRLETLWNFGLHLHRASTYPAATPFSFNWECPCRTSAALRAVHGHRYTLNVVWDWLTLNPERARQEFANYVRSFDDDTGMMAACTRPADPAPTPRHPESESRRVSATPSKELLHSHPPVWPYVAWQLYLVLRDRNFLEEMLRMGLRNAAWWEENRRTEDGLFRYVPTTKNGLPAELAESGRAEGGRSVSAELSCQMALFYLCLKRFAGQLGETALARDFQTRYDALAERIRSLLWDELTGCFCDRRANKPVRVLSAGTFYALLAGVASEPQVVRLCAHVAAEAEFFRYFPVPSAAAAETAGRGKEHRPVSSIAQTLWVVAGLRGAGRTRLAAQVAQRALEAAAEVLERDGTIYEFYNPDGSDQSSLASTDGPARYHAGNAPVHALAALGLFGIEMTRDGLVVDPVGVALPGQSAIEVQLPETRLAVFVRRTDALDGIEVKVRVGKRTLAEGFGRTVVGLGSLL